jgi:hypothetical protein
VVLSCKRIKLKKKQRTCLVCLGAGFAKMRDGKMKRIDVTNMVILCSGEEWRFEVSPCSKDAISLLERNERIVTWLMPVSGTIKDQIAAIRFKDGYYSLSLRMMKAIYRHVRLYKDFVNIENVNGIQKQRIPELLLREKIRTQSRFDVRDVSLLWPFLLYKHSGGPSPF